MTLLHCLHTVFASYCKSECQYCQSNSFLISLQYHPRNYSNKVHVGIIGQKAACETVSYEGSHYNENWDNDSNLSCTNNFQFFSFSVSIILLLTQIILKFSVVKCGLNARASEMLYKIGNTFT